MFVCFFPLSRTIISSFGMNIFIVPRTGHVAHGYFIHGKRLFLEKRTLNAGKEENKKEK